MSRLMLWFLLIGVASIASATKIEGIIKDPSGAVIAGASVSAKSPVTGQTIQAVTGADGRFSMDDLDAGAWLLTVQRDGFESAAKTVTTKDQAALEVAISLKIAVQEIVVEVGGKRSALANADPNYRALRDTVPAEAYNVENIELKRDAGTLTLRSGQIVFLAPVLNVVTTAVFIGDGRFQMKPAVILEQNHLNKIIGKREVDEEFGSAILYFTDSTCDEIKKQARAIAADPHAASVLKDSRRHMRQQTDRPRSMLESLLTGEDVPNIEAEILAELYNPRQAGSFRAYLHGKHYSDLRFLVIPHGAMPMMPSPEEVALLNISPGGTYEGIWYLSHRQDEWAKRTASSSEDKRVVTARHYRIETAISRGGHLTSIADVRFQAAVEGARMVRFGLLPTLRVTHVTGEKGREIAFIQESRKEDGSFHVILPEPMTAGNTYQLRIEYEGDKVIESEGNGNFAVGARTSWYPSVNSFIDRATYDLTFKVPKQFTLVGVGKLVKEWKEDDFAASQWKSDVPLAVAGFNYGLFKRKRVTDPESKYEIEAYATQEVPSYLSQYAQFSAMSPSAMADNAIVDAQNSMRLFQHWFGPAPYGRIAITQQPQFNFGQSWPTLVYLPLSAFLDSTQRWMLMGGNAFRFAEFIQEVAPHEVAHQWWGHMVGWQSYHDQWLSEGFADFSAAIFLEATEKPDQVRKFWDRLRDAIVQKNGFGNSPNDAGPLWMGLRLNSYKNPGAYSRLVYAKGAYILQMLRMLMRDEKTGDQDFKAMMHDYVQTHLHRNATSESFFAVVEKHMKPGLDLTGTHRIDWFVADWLYGTDLPKYRLEYSLEPADGGHVTFTGKLSQSEVSDTFLMGVPIYFELDGHVTRAGVVRIQGNRSVPIKIGLPKKPKRVLLNANHDILAADVAVKEM